MLSLFVLKPLNLEGIHNNCVTEEAYGHPKSDGFPNQSWEFGMFEGPPY